MMRVLGMCVVALVACQGEPRPVPRPPPAVAQVTVATPPAATSVEPLEEHFLTDVDQDKVNDDIDACPDDPELINGVEDEDGCPDIGPFGLTLVGRSLKKKQKIEFDTGRDTIKPSSFDLLDAIAQLIRDNPHLGNVTVEGHSDDMGPHVYGRRPTHRRAQAVRSFLLSRGVDPKRIVAKGFGDSKPIASNKTAEGRAKNRRIEVIFRLPDSQ